MTTTSCSEPPAAGERPHVAALIGRVGDSSTAYEKALYHALTALEGIARDDRRLMLGRAPWGVALRALGDVEGDLERAWNPWKLAYETEERAPQGTREPEEGAR